MIFTDKTGYRFVGWNGLAITVPATWEVKPTGPTHLIFEHNFQAVVEIRWQKTTAKNLDKCLPSSLEQYGKISGNQLVLQKTPSDIAQSLPAFEIQCFKVCTAKKLKVYFLFHADTSTYVILHLYNGDDIAAALSSIASLHFGEAAGEMLTWAIQDFRVDIPAGFSFSHFKMEAGFSTLYFKKASTLLHICRLAPADIRLKKNSQKEILATLLGRQPKSLQGANRDQEATLHYHQNPGIVQQILMRIQRKKPFIRASLHHNKKANRLLGVVMEGIHPVEENIHQMICASYEISPS